MGRWFINGSETAFGASPVLVLVFFASFCHSSWFKFGKNGVDAEGAGIYGSQSRDDFDRDDVEQFYLKKII
ncbi:hypothetical protein P8452_22084 [Trifolium repens]|nr:hypothetical protein P8452_22084 [Trifolium repens]